MVILSCPQKCCNCFQNTKRSYLQHCLLQTTAELRRAQRKHAIIKIIDSLGFLESISIDWHHILCLLVHIPSKSRKMNRLITFFHYKKCWISCFLHTLASVVSLFFCKILCNVAEIFSYFPQFAMLWESQLALSSFYLPALLPVWSYQPAPSHYWAHYQTPLTFLACVLLMTWVFVNFQLAQRCLSASLISQ